MSLLRARVERLYEQSQRDEEIDALTVHLRELARTLLAPCPPLRARWASCSTTSRTRGLAILVASPCDSRPSASKQIIETLDVRLRLKSCSS